MSLSYLEAEFVKSGRARPRLNSLVAQLKQVWTKLASTAWHLVSAPHVLPSMLRVVSALALSYWLVQIVKHNIS